MTYATTSDVSAALRAMGRSDLLDGLASGSGSRAPYLTAAFRARQRPHRSRVTSVEIDTQRR